MLTRMNRAFDLIERLLAGVVITILAVMVALIASQVAARYAVGVPLYWSEEVARHLMIWLFFMAAVIALRRGAHLSIDFVVESVSSPVRLALQLIVAVFLAAFFLLMTWFGWELASRTMVQRSGALHYPMGYVYGSLPISGFLMFCVVIERTAMTVAAFRSGPGQR